MDQIDQSKIDVHVSIGREESLSDKTSQMDFEQYKRFMNSQLAGCLDKFELFESKIGFFIESHSNIEKKIDENSALTRNGLVSIGGLVSAFEDFKKGIAFLSAIGNFFRRLMLWVAPIVTGLAALWALIKSFKTGEPPHQG